MRTVLTAYTLSECMETMAEYVSSYEKLGMRNIVFCEDRLTLVAERALVRKLGGTFHSSVTTFARFLKTDQKVLSKQGSVMAIGDIMTRLQDEKKLLCFKTASAVGNNAKCIYETIAQFAASEVTVETLDQSIALLPDDLLRRKLTDLRLIYGEYEKRLQEEGYIDESKYLALLPDCLRGDPALRGANVFFLCYSSFTAQALSAVRAAIETAENVFGIFCDGEEEVYTHESANAFLRACNEYGKTNVRKVGVPIGGEAEVLRTGLYDPERLSEVSQKTATENIRVYEGADMRGEAEFVAAKIARRMREDSKARYRDFAVLVPSVEGYSLTLKRVFNEYNIPCFFDEKKSLSAHPIGEFVLAALEAVRDGFSSASTQSLAQNYFFGESDEYRNYLLKYANYRGGAFKEITLAETEKRFDKEALERGRERFLSIVKHFGKKMSGAGYCRAVRAMLAETNAEEKLKELEESIEDASMRGYLSQIFAAIEGVLLEAERVLAGREMDVADFAAVLSEGLAATEISIIPMKSDAVFVG
ncbi:MAG: hypothetical protein IJV80_02145, partial [Clostridia bacterium]|nr:hypothetical protein [Clostridia bacterium]